MSEATRAALVTGCGKRDGVGRATALRLARRGVQVMVTDRQATGVLNRRQEVVGVKDDGWRGLESLVEEIEALGGTAWAATGDIGEVADADRMVGECVERFGRIDILVNNAAAPQGLDRQEIASVPVEVFDEVIRINLRGTYLMCRAAVPFMREQRYGRIVTVSSMAGIVAVPYSTSYASSKAAVLGLTRSLAMDVARWGITVNAVLPAGIATSRAVLSLDPELDVAAEIARRGERIPLGRTAQADDIAAAICFLASDDAELITAQQLVVDGGGNGGAFLPGPES